MKTENMSPVLSPFLSPQKSVIYQQVTSIGDKVTCITSHAYTGRVCLTGSVMYMCLRLADLYACHLCHFVTGFSTTWSKGGWHG